MNYHFCKPLAWAALAIAALLPQAASAVSAYDHATYVDGIAIYLGVVPADRLLGYSKASAERKMHGGVPLGDHYYHLMVVLFDTASGQRIANAQITATVGEVGSSVTTDPLEPMTIDGYASYGNYFEMPAGIVYSIYLRIRIPDRAAPIMAELHYRHAAY